MATLSANPIVIERRWTAADYRRLPEGPPDLAIEVVSPSTASRDRSRKLRAYYQAGVPWYWLVESDTLLITEYRHMADGYLVNQTAAATDEFAPTLFPGLALRMADLLGSIGATEEVQE